MEFEWITALITLTALELVLGIDNIVLISIVVDRLPVEKQSRSRKLGLLLALVFRVILLSMVTWLTKLTEPIITLASKGFSIRDIILLGGGLFLIAKATTEIYHFVEMTEEEKHASAGGGVSVGSVLVQIVIFDLIFSLDSVLTAVGLSSNLYVMIAAVMLSIVIMIVFADWVGQFVKDNPGIKMLALSFLVLIGVLLIAEGFGSHFERGYVYFAMAFSLVIEILNRRRKNAIKKSTV